MDLAHLSQRLTDVSIASVAEIALVLTGVRLLLVRIASPVARAYSEIVEAALIALVLVFVLIQPLVLKAFFIPSGSMLPTLVDDDHIVCNKLEYHFVSPRRSDIVIFVAPPSALELSPDPTPEVGPTDYIKRLIGLPGDVIETRRGYVAIHENGNTFEESHNDIRRAFQLNDSDKQHVKIEPADVAIYDGRAWTRYGPAALITRFGVASGDVTFHPGVTLRNGRPLHEPYVAEDPDYDLKLVNGESYIDDPDVGFQVNGTTPTLDQQRALRDAPAGPVPPGCVFVMGDNRNDSNDSTRWGPLDRNRIVGKASVIFWPPRRVRVLH